MSGPAEPQRVLVVKLSSLGDIIHATPCLRALRRAYPRAEMVVAVERRWAAVLRSNPNVDRLIEAPSCERLTAGHLWEIGSTLSAARPFDLAIDLQGTRRSAAWVYLSGARVKMGRGWPRPGWRTAVTPDLRRHAVVACVEVCRAAGIEVEDLDPEVFTNPGQEGVVDGLLKAERLPTAGLILLNPFSRWRSKSWPAAAEFLERFSHPVVITGGPEEADAAQAAARGRAVSLAGRLTLEQALCLYQRARLMVSCDSGPMHAAAALGVPVVALFGPTHPERTGPWGTGHRVVQALRPTSHSAYRSDPEARYMGALTVEMVLEAVEQTLRSDGRRA